MKYKKFRQIYQQDEKKFPISYNSLHSPNLSNPEVWGPSFWFTLHNCANNYPISANNIYKKYTKGFIEGIPFMIPCTSCSEHAKIFIQNHDLDIVCSGRDEMFKFFWSFHNAVNKRTGKTEIPLEDVKKMYSKPVVIKIMSKQDI